MDFSNIQEARCCCHWKGWPGYLGKPWCECQSGAAIIWGSKNCRGTWFSCWKNKCKLLCVLGTMSCCNEHWNRAAYKKQGFVSQFWSLKVPCVSVPAWVGTGKDPPPGRIEGDPPPGRSGEDSPPGCRLQRRFTRVSWLTALLKALLVSSPSLLEPSLGDQDSHGWSLGRHKHSAVKNKTKKIYLSFKKFFIKSTIS